MPLIRAGATPDFPFAELSPEDFHRLALHLLERDPSYQFIENHGATGSDGGVDLIADLKISETIPTGDRTGRRIRVLIQVKRVQAFTLSSARAEIERLRRSGPGMEFDRYLLIASCKPTASALTELRAGCTSLGISDVEVWDISLLTARLLGHRDLLEFFFAISDTAAWLREPDVADRYRDVRRLVTEGHPLLVVVGSRPEFDFVPDINGATPSPGNSFRWLIQHKIVSEVLAHGSDFSMTLGDLLQVNSGLHPGKHQSVWQPPTERPLGSLVVELVNKYEIHSALRPALVVLGCSSEQLRSLDDRLGDIEPRVVEGGLLVFGNPEAGEMSYSHHLNGQRFLLSMQEALAPDWLTFHVEKIDFSAPYDFESILAGGPVQPAIATSGHWPEAPEDFPAADRPLRISDLPGTGKTARGFRIAYLLNRDSSFYLDLSTVPGVSTDDLIRLVIALEGRGRSSLLVLDNIQAAAETTERLERLLRGGASRRVEVVLLETRPFSDLEMLGGEIRHEVLRDHRWKANRAALAAWSEEQLGSHPPELKVAEVEASNLWHFFYLLRGGATKLSADLAAARGDELSDVVWYMVAGLQVFMRQPATIRTLFAQLTDRNLWPLTVGGNSRGRWLVDCITSLLEKRRIVPVADGFACRHAYEAFGVLRLGFNSDSQMTGTSFREASVQMFAEAIPQVEIPDHLNNHSELTKWDVYDFVRNHVGPALARHRELEQAVSYHPEIQRAVDHAWAGLVKLVEQWPAHPLYWLFNRSDFRGSLLRFSPFHSIETLHAFDTLDGDGDAIDIEYMIKGLLAYEAHRSAQMHAESKRLKGDMLSSLGEIKALLAMAEAHREKSRPRSVLSPFALQRRRRIEEADETIASLDLQVKHLEQSIQGTASYTSESVALPFRLETNGEARWTPEHSSRWLEHHTSPFAKALNGLDERRLIDAMRALKSARPLLLAHLWLLSPDFGRRIFKAMLPAWRDETVHQIKEAVRSYTPLHLSVHDDFLAIFVSELAEVSPPVAAWISDGEGGALGKRIREAGNGAYLRGETATKLIPPSRRPS